ncbi:MAG TPA: hypothetical protein VKT82_05815 [Ktedonobacterales bacterium]|nr:hypothetical protein [Ktedonobacterales bacterium]
MSQPATISASTSNLQAPSAAVTRLHGRALAGCRHSDPGRFYRQPSGVLCPGPARSQ